MFRLLKVRPPNGWNAVAWELAIVTLGVLIALAAQQWADGRSTSGKVEASKAAVREEVGEHYRYAVEYRVVYPCLQAQLRRLRDRVIASGHVNDPAPIYREANFDYVLRIPSKFFPTNVWTAAVNDGLIRHYDAALRSNLGGHYAQLATIRSLSASNDESDMGLEALRHPLPLDPAVRYSIVRDIEQFGGRLEYLDVLYGQMIDYIQKVGMLPPPQEARATTERYGSYQFCRAKRLPMRSFKDAMQAVPN